MRTVREYRLKLKREQTIAIASGSQFLSLQMRDDDEGPSLWMLIDTESQTQNVVFEMYGTGELVGNPGSYIGTVQGDLFSWHFFVKGQPVQ